MMLEETIKNIENNPTLADQLKMKKYLSTKEMYKMGNLKKVLEVEGKQRKKYINFLTSMSKLCKKYKIQIEGEELVLLDINLKQRIHVVQP